MSLVKFTVQGQNLYPNAKENVLASDSIEFIQFQFNFSKDWDKLEKTASFTQGENVYLVLLTEDRCFVPNVIKEGPFYVTVVGIGDEGEKATTRQLKLYMYESGYNNEGTEPPPPDPDIYAQILQLAKDAQEIAQSVRDDADSGKFNGEQGPTGPQGYTYTPAVSEEGVISWTNDGSLPNPSPVNIKGPQGKQGIQGVQGKQGERGYVYTPNVSQDGIISWTNDGDLENPDPVDIRGPEGPQGGQGEQGIQGPRGYTYTPSVGEDGTVSWTNDGNLPNPDPVNITGPQGETGETPDITAGTVKTLEPGQDATAEITGETPNLVLNLSIPKGQPGQDAPQIDDDVVSATNPWSSLKIVDTLAPPFSSSGPVVTCTPVAGYPLHVVSQIMPVQGGEGDPSPDNVRPISGWDEADLWVGGANLFNPDNLSGGQLTELDGVPVYQFRDGATGNFMFPVPNIKNQQFTLRLKLAGTATQDFNFVLYYSDGSYDLKNIGNGLDPCTITSSAGKTLTSIQSTEGWSVIRYIDLSQTMLVVGLSVPADFSPYRGQTITLPFGQTVYGGTLDWTTGVLTVTHAEIASYSGEALHGAWISDRDVYSQGATPTTGAQVVYELSVPRTIQLTTTEMLALSGANTIYTDTGNTIVSGRADPNTIIQQLAARIAALEGQAINR